MRTTGTVKFFDLAKQYGLINTDQGRTAVVHQHDLTGVPNHVLMKKDRVTFELARDKSGLRAIDVELARAT